MAAELAQLEGAIEYRFRRRELLAQAVTHSSCSQAAAPSANNERLEFLGDSILEFIVSERLSAQFPARPEGELTKLRASLVSAANLVKVVDGLERQFGELRERMAHLEGLLEGLREAISGRAAASMQGEPKQPKELRRPSVSSRPRKNKGWFYWKDPV